MKQNIKKDPEGIFGEYRAGNAYKSSVGEYGLFEQTKINERFYVGDQWHGAGCGNSRPLVRRNIIKRIGEYKMSAVCADSVAVNYSADGIPDSSEYIKEAGKIRRDMLNGKLTDGVAGPSEISVITSALSGYFRITAERVKFEKKKEQVLRNAYISGTGIAYTYWNPDIETGLYADDRRTAPIKGDIDMEVLDIENVIFGDPTNDDIETQPYIIIVQRKTVDEVKRTARRCGMPDDEIHADSPSGYSFDNESGDSRHVTLLTKIFKEYDNNDKTYRVMAVQVTQNSVVRPCFDMLIKCYPIAKFCWERRKSSAYGESEINYLIPNQIAINRALTAELWSALAVGMPKLLVNGDLISEPISNDPGQIIKVYTPDGDVSGAMAYVNPPCFAEQYTHMISELAITTMTDNGANDAALGDLDPNNATAIIQMRQAAMQPMKLYKSRFYDFLEDIARIWASFWLNLYGDRYIKIQEAGETYYLPFKSDRYRNLLFTAKVNVGESTARSEQSTVTALNALLEDGLITFDQYLDRMPEGLIPNAAGLKSTKTAVNGVKTDEKGEKAYVKEDKEAAE